MRVLQDTTEQDFRRDALTFALGAAGGLALGMVISRRAESPDAGRGIGNELRERARTVARRLRPAHLRRMAVEQDELTRLEDAVLDVLLADRVLSERGIDVGAISPGILELSGSVWTEDEAERAVEIASAVSGVHTVVNRLEVEDETRTLQRARQRLEDEPSAPALYHEESRVGGMGMRQQSLDTDPDRPDDSQRFGENALEDADREQWESEGLAHSNSKLTERPEVRSASWREDYDEDELDNQDPHTDLREIQEND